MSARLAERRSWGMVSARHYRHTRCAPQVDFHRVGAGPGWPFCSIADAGAASEDGSAWWLL